MVFLLSGVTAVSDQATLIMAKAWNAIKPANKLFLLRFILCSISDFVVKNLNTGLTSNELERHQDHLSLFLIFILSPPCAEELKNLILARIDVPVSLIIFINL